MPCNFNGALGISGRFAATVFMVEMYNYVCGRLRGQVSFGTIGG
jgi:hypothetical protein